MGVRLGSRRARAGEEPGAAFWHVRARGLWRTGREGRLMPFFAKKAVEPPAPALAQLPAPSGPAISSLPAPKATDLERDIRANIWGHISPGLAHAAGLSLPELVDWVHGVTRLSTPQIEALARRMGILDTPETGVDAIRARLVAVMRKRPTFEWLDWPARGRGEDDLRAFAAGENCLTLAELNLLAKEFYGKAEIDPQTAMLRSTAPEPTSMGRPPDPYDPTAETYPPRVMPGVTMRLYPRPNDAEHKPAQLRHSGWV